MKKRRYSSGRAAQIIGWTTASIVWAVAVGGRAFGYFGAPEQTVAIEEVPTTVTESPVLTFGTVPNMPEGGLVILRVPTTDAAAAASRSSSSSGSSSSGVTPTTKASATATTSAPATATPAPPASSSGS